MLFITTLNNNLCSQKLQIYSFAIDIKRLTDLVVSIIFLLILNKKGLYGQKLQIYSFEFTNRRKAMARGKKQIEGQYELELFNYDSTNYVVQSNLLVMSKQTLKLNSSKIIRAAIMQVVKEDMDFKIYKISLKELADLLGIDTSNLYRCIMDIIKDIQNNCYISVGTSIKVSVGCRTFT